MNCPLKLKKPNCNKCDFGKEGLCDYPHSIKKKAGKGGQMSRIKDLDHLLVEALRAAEMRQGCTNHTYYAEIIRKQISQLFPQPLDDEELREKAQKLKGMIKDITKLSSDREKWPEMFAIIDQILALLQPLDKKLRGKALLTDEEIGDAVFDSGEGWLEASGQIIGKQVAKAQLKKALALLPKIEEAKREEGERIFKELLKHQTPTIKDLGLIEITMCVEDWQALSGKGGK